MNNESSSSTGLIVGVILGILIIGGIWLWVRQNDSAPADTNNGSLDVNVNLPKENNSEANSNQ